MNFPACYGRVPALAGAVRGPDGRPIWGVGGIDRNGRPQGGREDYGAKGGPDRPRAGGAAAAWIRMGAGPPFIRTFMAGFTPVPGNGYTGFPMETTLKGQGRSFKLDQFEGPLDLLLFLIKKNEVNIYDIPIARITEQYLDYVSYMEKLDLEDATGFQAMAATLLHIKSRTLLPLEADLDDEGVDPRQELVDQLIEYQKFKKLSGLMEEKEREAEWIIERKRLQRDLPFDDEGLWEQVDIWDLLKTFTALLEDHFPKERIIDLYEEVTVNEKTALLMEFLENRGQCRFTDLLVRKGSIMDFVCAFLAILEAAKTRLILICQNRMFGDILLRVREGALG
jgi:segregation and condensation protein A